MVQAAHLSSYQLLMPPARRALAACVTAAPAAKDAGIEIAIPFALCYEVAERSSVGGHNGMKAWLLDWQATHKRDLTKALVPELAAHLLVATVFAAAEPAQRKTAAACARELQREFSAQRARGAKDLDELALLVLGWCYLANDVLQEAGFATRDIEEALKAPASRAEKIGPDRGSVAPLGRWSKASERAATTAMAKILATMGYRFCRLVPD